jgi:hypothetical protein
MNPIALINAIVIPPGGKIFPDDCPSLRAQGLHRARQGCLPGGIVLKNNAIPTEFATARRTVCGDKMASQPPKCATSDHPCNSLPRMASSGMMLIYRDLISVPVTEMA